MDTQSLTERYGIECGNWLSDQIAEHMGDLEYSDNFRVALVGDAEEEAEYDERARSGCCGSCDREVEFTDGRKFLIGCNYGH